MKIVEEHLVLRTETNSLLKCFVLQSDDYEDNLYCLKTEIGHRFISADEFKRLNKNIIDRIESQNKTQTNRTKIKDWLENPINKVSTRLTKALLEISFEYEYIEDITVPKLLRTRGSGRGTCKEFLKLININNPEKLKRDEIEFRSLLRIK